MNQTYQQYQSIPIIGKVPSSISGSPVYLTLPYPVGSSLSSNTLGSMTFTVFNGGTSSIAQSTLNGSPVVLNNIFMNAFSSSGTWGIGIIQEGLTGAQFPQSTQYDAWVGYRLADGSNNTIYEAVGVYTFYVQARINSIDPRTI